MILLGVNIDHVATLRQARGTRYPDPIAAAALAEAGGADQITVHLREDRRHIQDQDVRLLRRTVTTPLNLEMACTSTMLDLACELRPNTVTLVPERRQELTTEGGLNVLKGGKTLRQAIQRLQAQSIRVSLFVDPELPQVAAAKEYGVEAIELHTGSYCNDPSPAELQRLQVAATAAQAADLVVCAGHGLNAENIRAVVKALPEVHEYNIGHSLVARAVFVGLERAVREMQALLNYQPEAVP